MEFKENTPDGKFTLLPVECLASCGTAPMMQVNDLFVERLTLERVDELIAELNFFFKKIEGDWLITRVETVRTLSAGAAPGGSPPGV